MEKFLEQLSSYHLLNFIIPGVIFIVLCNDLGVGIFDISNIWLLLFSGYFFGMVFSRIGSVFIEPILKKKGVVFFYNHDDYLKAEPKDNKIQTLVTMNNIYRTFVAMFVILLLVYILCLIPFIRTSMNKPFAIILFLVFMILIFILSYRKQTNYINDRIENANHTS